MTHIVIKKTAYHEVGELVRTEEVLWNSNFLDVYKKDKLAMVVHKEDMLEYFKTIEKHRDDVINSIIL